MNSVEEIEKRLATVQREPQTFTQDKTFAFVECPLCTDCPMCGGDYNDVDTAVYDFDAYAAGVQVIGIGEDLENFTEFFKHAREDIRFLLDQLQAVSGELGSWTNGSMRGRV